MTPIYGCVDLAPPPYNFGPGHEITGTYTATYLDGSTVRSYIQDLGTSYVRLWISWAAFQPTAATANIGQTLVPYEPSGQQWYQWLDKQLFQIAADGRKVILCLGWKFPTWANGSDPYVGKEAVWQLEDRVQPYTTAAYVQSVRNGTAPYDQTKFKGYETRFPTAVDPTSPWATWITWLCNRYQSLPAGTTQPPGANQPAYAYGNSATGNRLITILELVNEPNLFCWPQEDTSGAPSAPCVLAQMVTTASGIAGPRGIMIGAPACADSRGGGTNPRGFTQADDFVTYMLVQLSGFTPTLTVVTHHNYIDYEQRLPWASTMAKRVLDLMNTYSWTSVGLWLSEGGSRATPASTSASDLAYGVGQVALGYPRVFGASVYPLLNQGGSTSGLIDPVSQAGGYAPYTKRAAYTTWKNLRITGVIS
jgi:hypothetical protein